MTMSQTLGDDELVLAIATTDDWLHAGRVSEVLDHARSHRGGQGHPGGSGLLHPESGRLLDFFDADARRVHPVLDDRLEVGVLVRTEGDPDGEVRDRIERVLARAQHFLEENPGGGPAAHWPARTQVPRPDGSFEEVVAALRTATNGSRNSHSGGWLHNLMHAMGG
jgi:hypothetical protein